MVVLQYFAYTFPLLLCMNCSEMCAVSVEVLADVRV